MRRIVILFAGVLLGQIWGMDIDTGQDATGAAKMLEAGSLMPTGWVRLRGADMTKVSETRVALAKLHERGLQTCVMLRWPAKDRKVTYLPSDLREAYENVRKLGAAYGDSVDAWEVDNEPDLGFVPEAAERYAAFLKATYLGINAGSREHGARSKEPLVIMGALGLPPGPWLERFAANDGFSYTDGFNYHYYGYADDFSGVYGQHERAVAELTAALLKAESGKLKAEGSDKSPIPGSTPQLSAFSSQLSSDLRQEKSLPVFLTEIGYGMLGKAARDTKEGRLRQWRWFKSVGEQATGLRIEAPMAFFLPPYLEYDTSEFGLTVPAKPATEKAESGKLKAEEWLAGGIEYTASDFEAKSAEPWMDSIGKEIGGNQITPALAQWLEIRKSSGLRSQVSGFADGSRSWTVSVPVPSPVVIDFLAGEGLSFVKRYNGSFVVGREPSTTRKPETGNLKPEGERPPSLSTRPTTSSQQPATPPSRHEEFMLHVRTANGNLYEVYPTRQATPEWQSYSEPQSNFSMSFYGRAELPWRFKDNRPASLVVVMYPRSLPVTYEFRRVQLVRIGQTFNTEVAESTEKAMRYGQGKVLLYNFSDKEVSGRLTLPESMKLLAGSSELGALTESSVLKLLPGECREVPVIIKVPWERFERINAPIRFVPEDQVIPSTHFVTSFIPDIGGMGSTVVAGLLTQQGARSAEQGANHSFVGTRVRASEEAPMAEQDGVFFQEGAKVKRIADGFTVTITDCLPGKQQRVEVEIPWPERLAFTVDEFLNLEYRLKPDDDK